VHVVLIQKYGNAIPKWLEEGLANLLSDAGSRVDYAYLSSRLPEQVRSLVLPTLCGISDLDAEFKRLGVAPLQNQISTGAV
jgi:hypothetical protein